MPQTTPQTDQHAPSRRTVLKRAGVAGGVAVWATPVVQSMLTPAFAGTPAEDRCTYTLRLKYDPSEGFSTDEGAGNASCEDLVPGWDAATEPTVVAASSSAAQIYVGTTLLGSVSAAPDSNPQCYNVTFALAGYTVVSAFYVVKDGRDTGSTGGSGCEPNDAGTVTQSGQTYKFCADLTDDPRGGGFSHVLMVLCLRATP